MSDTPSSHPNDSSARLPAVDATTGAPEASGQRNAQELDERASAAAPATVALSGVGANSEPPFAGRELDAEMSDAPEVTYRCDGTQHVFIGSRRCLCGSVIDPVDSEPPPLKVYGNVLPDSAPDALRVSADELAEMEGGAKRPRRRRSDWRTRKPRIPETSECHYCNKPAPLICVDEEVTWGTRERGFAATPVNVRSWYYRCDTCPGEEPGEMHEWYTMEAMEAHQTTVWRATMEAMSDKILALESLVTALQGPDTPSDDPPRAADATPSAVVDANEVDDLIEAFQSACVGVEFARTHLDHRIQSDRMKERAILRNDLRARLLAMPDKPSEKQSRAEDSTPLDNSNELHRLRAHVSSLTGALEEARRDAEDAGEYAEEVNRVSELLVDFDGDQGFESVSKHLAAILIEFGELRAAARPPETPERSLSEDANNA